MGSVGIVVLSPVSADVDSCLTTGIHSVKCVVRRFRRCANVIVCTYTNLDSIAFYTPRLYGLDYCFWATNLYNLLLYRIL